MEIKNLTPQEVEMIETKLAEMQSFNPHLSWLSYPISDPTGTAVDPPVPHHGYHNDVYNPTISQLEEIKEAVASLDRKIDRIFGGHALINGQFVKIT